MGGELQFVVDFINKSILPNTEWLLSLSRDNYLVKSFPFYHKQAPFQLAKYFLHLHIFN